MKMLHGLTDSCSHLRMSFQNTKKKAEFKKKKKQKVKNKKEKQAKTSKLHSRPAESTSLAGNKIQCAKQGLTDYQLISSIFRAMLDLEINSQ